MAKAETADTAEAGPAPAPPGPNAHRQRTAPGTARPTEPRTAASAPAQQPTAREQPARTSEQPTRPTSEEPPGGSEREPANATTPREKGTLATPATKQTEEPDSQQRENGRDRPGTGPAAKPAPETGALAQRQRAPTGTPQQQPPGPARLAREREPRRRPRAEGAGPAADEQPTKHRDHAIFCRGDGTSQRRSEPTRPRRDALPHTGEPTTPARNSAARSRAPEAATPP